jgi:hypothetical protein
MSFEFRQKKSDYIPSKFEYDLPPTKVKKADAVAWLAQIVYPTDTNTTARKKVRRLMSYHNIGGKMLNARAFFSWAIKVSDWGEKLQSIPNIPYAPLHFSPVSSIGITPSADFLKLPSELAELQNLCIQQHFELLETSKKIEQLEKENSELQKKLQIIFDRDEEIRLKKVAGGLNKSKARGS